jgi:outer membrane protein, multidrug efflux system
LFLVTIALTLQGCFVAKDYERPQVADESMFRTDQIPKDSLSLGEVSWRELFTDTYLKNYIEEGLENNLDIRVALQQIETANAYFRQGKSRIPSHVGS